MGAPFGVHRVFQGSGLVRRKDPDGLEGQLPEPMQPVHYFQVKLSDSVHSEFSRNRRGNLFPSSLAQYFR